VYFVQILELLDHVAPADKKVVGVFVLRFSCAASVGIHGVAPVSTE
jgi:hypothetical protein